MNYYEFRITNRNVRSISRMARYQFRIAIGTVEKDFQDVGIGQIHSDNDAKAGHGPLKSVGSEEEEEDIKL